MRVLVLGGTGFVGRAVVGAAVARGDEVTVLNRGLRPPVPGVLAVTGDRTAAGGLSGLAGGSWDAVVDTWSAAPSVVAAAVRALSGRAGHYTYVSSRSVYAEGGPPDEDAPVVDADPGVYDPADYAGAKRGGELAAAGFDGPVLLARAGLILGPYEDVGRLPWWLRRLQRGGPTLAPGPAGLGVQLVDARDLAVFVLGAASAGLGGVFNVVSPPGFTTMGELLRLGNAVTGGRAVLRWVDPQVILDAGVQPWTQVPIWWPPGPYHEFLHGADVSRAVAAGLRLRPVAETVADTWAWLSAAGDAPQRADRPRPGLDPAVEAALLG